MRAGISLFLTVWVRSWRHVACFSCALMIAPASAADISGYLVATTDYVFRGVTFSDGNAAVQLGGDVGLDSGFYFGVWGSTIDIRNSRTRRRDKEVVYYLGYSHEITSHWAVYVNAVAYSYPGTQGDIDYGYHEYSLSANYNDRVWLEYSFSPNLFNTGRNTNAFRVNTEWPLVNQFALGAGAGYYDVSALSGSGYGYWDLGFTRPFGRIEFDLRYHDTNRPVPIVSTSDRANERIVLSARIQF